jgi:hypothetical protein
MNEYMVRFSPKSSDAIIQVLIVKQMLFPLLRGRIPLLNQGCPDELLGIINLDCQLVQDGMAGFTV